MLVSIRSDSADIKGNGATMCGAVPDGMFLTDEHVTEPPQEW